MQFILSPRVGNFKIRVKVKHFIIRIMKLIKGFFHFAMYVIAPAINRSLQTTVVEILPGYVLTASITVAGS